MAFDAIVRVSFNSSKYNTPNPDVDETMLGSKVKKKQRTRPFRKVGTACYQCTAENEALVLDKLAKLLDTLKRHAANVDFATITLVQTPARPIATIAKPTTSTQPHVEGVASISVPEMDSRETARDAGGEQGQIGGCSGHLRPGLLPAGLADPAGAAGLADPAGAAPAT